MPEVIQGVVHGRTIELATDPGLQDGQVVEVTVRVVEPPTTWGEGLRRCAGALADSWTEEDDRILEEIRRERYQDRRPEPAE